MNVREQPIRDFVFSRAILVVIGALLLGAGVFVLCKQHGNWLFGGSLVLLGAAGLYAALQSVADVFRGKPILEQIASLPLPGTAVCELTVPNQMCKGRVIVFFQDTIERYAGKVTLTKLQADDTPPVTVTLLRVEPSRIRVPKFLRKSDAGDASEFWARGTGQSTDPVVLKFSFPVQSQERLKLEFELESNFKGTNLENRFPVTGKETVRIVVKE